MSSLSLFFIFTFVLLRWLSQLVIWLLLVTLLVTLLRYLLLLLYLVLIIRRQELGYRRSRVHFSFLVLALAGQDRYIIKEVTELTRLRARLAKGSSEDENERV
jgi:hypothetical protein